MLFVAAERDRRNYGVTPHLCVVSSATTRRLNVRGFIVSVRAAEIATSSGGMKLHLPEHIESGDRDNGEQFATHFRS